MRRAVRGRHSQFFTAGCGLLPGFSSGTAKRELPPTRLTGGQSFSLAFLRCISLFPVHPALAGPSTYAFANPSRGRFWPASQPYISTPHLNATSPGETEDFPWLVPNARAALLD
jgi:hypothetical protein